MRLEDPSSLDSLESRFSIDFQQIVIDFVINFCRHPWLETFCTFQAVICTFQSVIGPLKLASSIWPILRPTNPRMTPSLTVILSRFRRKLQDGFKTEEATVESDQATAVADAAQNDKAQSDFKRFEELFKTKVVSPQDVDQFRATAKSAQATLNAAEKKVLIDEALVSEARAQVDAFAGLVQSVNAQIHESDANLATAKLNQSYTRILAPESGWVTQKSVEPGAYVQAGQNLFALVPKQVWVTANFKEDQIGRMQPGQRVEIEVDALHGRKFRGLVDSIQAGSGARFSLLPPQNATGNYVKVVQRIRIDIPDAAAASLTLVLRRPVSDARDRLPALCALGILV